MHLRERFGEISFKISYYHLGGIQYDLIHAFLVRKRMAVLHNHYVDFLEIDIDSVFVPF